MMREEPIESVIQKEKEKREQEEKHRA